MLKSSTRFSGRKFISSRQVSHKIYFQESGRQSFFIGILKPIDYDNPIDLLSSDHIRVQPHLNAILVTESRPIICILSGFYPFEILPGVLLLCRSSKLFSSLMFELLFICLLDRIFSIPRVAVTGLSPDKSTLN